MQTLGQTRSAAAQEPAFEEQVLDLPSSVFDLLPIGVYVCDRKGAVIQFNSRAVEMWGGKPPRWAARTCGWLTTWSLQWTTYFLFTIALLLGIGFGTMFPAYNTLFVNLAPNNQRGTATSTYLTSWDVGIGAGMLLGGYIAEIATFKMAYLFGAALTVISLFYFRSKVAPHFHQHKLR